MKSDNRKAGSNQQPTTAKPTPTQANTAKADRQGADQGSLAIERAEGEGMLAPSTEGSASRAAPKPGDGSQVEGEGSYTATRRYDEGLARSVAKGDAERLAKEAASALDGPEGASLRKAEQAAKHGHAR